jgi:hypothetical protein
VILEAVKTAKEQIKEYKKAYPDTNRAEKADVGADQLTGLIIGASSTLYGMGACVDIDDDNKKSWYNVKFNPKKHAGNQWDLEWIYVVDVDKKNVDVYGNGQYTSASKHMKSVVHPDNEIKHLKEEYKDKRLLELKEIYVEYEETGWTINEANLSGENQPAKPTRVRKITWEVADA